MATLPEQGSRVVITPAQLQRRISGRAIDLKVKIHGWVTLSISVTNFQATNPAVALLFGGQKRVAVRGSAGRCFALVPHTLQDLGFEAVASHWPLLDRFDREQLKPQRTGPETRVALTIIGKTRMQDLQA